MANPVFDHKLIAEIPANTDWSWNFTLYEPEAPSDDVDYSGVIASGDTVRFRAWSTDGSAAEIDVSTDDVSPNSRVEITNAGTADTTPAVVKVILRAAVTNITAGEYSFLLDVTDVSDNNSVHATAKGKIAITGVGT